MVFLGLLFMGCSSQEPVATPTPEPTYTPIPTATPTPTPRPTPDLIAPDNMNFGEILEDTPVRGQLEIGNKGEAPLTIYSIQCPDYINFDTYFPKTISPSDSRIFEFSLDTDNPMSFSNYLSINSNDVTKTIQLRGDIQNVEIKAEEWEKEVVEEVTTNNPTKVNVESTSIKGEWEWNFIFPNPITRYTVTIENNGDGEARGTIVGVAKPEGGGNRETDSKSFYLNQGEEKVITLRIDTSYFTSYDYEVQFRDVTEHIRKRVDMVSIVRYVEGNKVETLDSFEKESEKTDTWDERDYYNPDTATYKFLLEGAVRPTPEPTRTFTPTPTPTPEPVDFVVSVDNSEIEDCGWTCREVPATLKNTGGKDAHNVRVKLEMYCEGGRVEINGQDYITEYIGTLPAGQIETRTKEINVGILDGNCIRSNGARIVFTVTSTEKDKTLEQWYNP